MVLQSDLFIFLIIFILCFINDYIPFCFLINMWGNYCRMWSNSNNFHYTIHWYKLIAGKQSVFPATAHDVQRPTSYFTINPSAHLLPFRKQHKDFTHQSLLSDERSRDNEYHELSHVQAPIQKFWGFWKTGTAVVFFPPFPWSLFFLLIILKWNSLGVWEMCCKR